MTFDETVAYLWRKVEAGEMKDYTCMQREWPDDFTIKFLTLRGDVIHVTAEELRARSKRTQIVYRESYGPRVLQIHLTFRCAESTQGGYCLSPNWVSDWIRPKRNEHHICLFTTVTAELTVTLDGYLTFAEIKADGKRRFEQGTMLISTTPHPIPPGVHPYDLVIPPPPPPRATKRKR